MHPVSRRSLILFKAVIRTFKWFISSIPKAEYFSIPSLDKCFQADRGDILGWYRSTLSKPRVMDKAGREVHARTFAI